MKTNIRTFPPNAPRPALRLRRMQGYTLIEIMLVLSIISVLLGAGIYYMVGNLDSAKERRVEADLAMFSIQLKSYESENFFMPTTEQGRDGSCIRSPPSDPKPRRWRQWLEKPPHLIHGACRTSIAIPAPIIPTALICIPMAR